MLNKIVVSLACAGAVIAPAIAEQSDKTDAGGIALTAGEMDSITAGGLADAFADVTPDRIAVIVSAEGSNTAKSTSSAFYKVTYGDPLDEAPQPDIETDYEGRAEGDGQIFVVGQNVEAGETEAPGDSVNPAPEPVLTRAQLYARDNAMTSIYSVGSINELIARLRGN
jgi:hypothetical protein